MRKKLYALASLCLGGALVGCTSAGNHLIAEATRESVAANLVKGQTTQNDVRRAYGDPIKVSFTESGNESWEYEFTRTQSKPTNFIPYINMIHQGYEGEKKSLVIFFDKKNIIRDYTLSQSKVDVSTGLITK